MYFMRFLLQWIASERLRRSIIPETFWYFSFAGGLMLLIYAFHRADPVITLGQFFGLFIYARNIHLIWLHKRLASRIVALSEAGSGVSENSGAKIAEISAECAGIGCDLPPNSLCQFSDAGWSSPVARQAHNLKAAGSNPAPATTILHIGSPVSAES